MLIDFFGTGTRLAIGDELFGGEVRIFGAIDDIEEAEFDGVGHCDAEIQIPRRMENWRGGVVERWGNR